MTSKSSCTTCSCSLFHSRGNLLCHFYYLLMNSMTKTLSALLLPHYYYLQYSLSNETRLLKTSTWSEITRQLLIIQESRAPCMYWTRDSDEGSLGLKIKNENVKKMTDRNLISGKRVLPNKHGKALPMCELYS